MIKVGSYQDAVVLDELVTRVLCDTSPRNGKADAVYLFGETRDNENSVLEAGKCLWRLGRVKRIAVCKETSQHGFPGFDSWQKKLAKAGVPSARIIGISPASDFPPSTDAEAAGLIRFAASRGWKNLYITAHPIHQLRAFVSSVSAAHREKAKLFIFNFVGFPQRWEDHIIHSQGIQRGTRSGLIRKELKKISHYFNSGDLISPKEVLRYMNKRDDIGSYK